MRNLIFVVLSLGTVACSDDNAINSDEAARRAYLSLDGSIEKSIALGFAGYNAASSATIDPQSTTGDAAGTMVVTGKVDQGSSTNKGMRLNVAMVGYDDGATPYNDANDTVHVVFDTDVNPLNQPYIDLQLKNFPNGTLDGTVSANTSLLGVYHLSGDIKGDLTLSLTIAGSTMAGAAAGDVVRVPGTTTVIGTATNSDGGVYDINITL